MADHTPHPWHLRRDHSLFEVFGADDLLIADSFSFYRDADSAAANARLVAAAPRMAELLQRWLRQGVFPELAQETRDVLSEAGVQP
jgi:hypothetical protein